MGRRPGRGGRRRYATKKWGPVLKLISLLKRADGISKDEFRQWVTVDHAPFAKALPGLRKYVVNVTIDDDEFAYDAVNEMWFDSEDARAAAFASDAGAAAGGDAAAHASDRVHLKTTEYVQL
jgi:uncharacterized protein (TIGR02118 family)